MEGKEKETSDYVLISVSFKKNIVHTVEHPCNGTLGITFCLVLRRRSLVVRGARGVFPPFIDEMQRCPGKRQDHIHVFTNKRCPNIIVLCV